MKTTTTLSIMTFVALANLNGAFAANSTYDCEQPDSSHFSAVIELDKSKAWVSAVAGPTEDELVELTDEHDEIRIYEGPSEVGGEIQLQFDTEKLSARVFYIYTQQTGGKRRMSFLADLELCKLRK